MKDGLQLISLDELKQSEVEEFVDYTHPSGVVVWGSL